MRAQRFSIVFSCVALLLLAVGVAGAFPPWASPPPAAMLAPVTSGISYQGRLTSPGGSPLNGTYAMRFVVYDQQVGGTALWNSGDVNITVADGLFATKLGVDQADFNGQALWLRISVEGQVLSPRQEILPAPYALSLRPGADIVGDTIAAADATLAGYAPATGSALYADAHNGAGVIADSESSYGVWGSSNTSWGGYFTSGGGYGIRVQTNGGDHYDHGVYATAVGGYGVYAQSSNNMGVRGEAGDVSGISQPVGTVGVVGIGANRGVHGSSGNGLGVYGSSAASYGMWGQSQTYRGMTGRTSRVDNNYGVYTPDNLYSLNYHLAGAVMQVMQNSGDDALSPGDVVEFDGINRAVTGMEGPLVQVKKASTANSTAVAGVVYSAFNLDAVDPSREHADDASADDLAAVEVTPAGSVAPGEFLLVIVQGPAQVRVGEMDGSIQPGDLLATGAAFGTAGKAETLIIEGAATARPGTVFAKALEAVASGQGMIYVYVTLQ